MRMFLSLSPRDITINHTSNNERDNEHDDSIIIISACIELLLKKNVYKDYVDVREKPGLL